MTLTLQDSLDRLQLNEVRLDDFVNDPQGRGYFQTSDGQQVPTVPAVIQRTLDTIEPLAATDGAAKIGFILQVEGAAPTTVEAMLLLLHELIAGIEAGATKNAPDAALRDRATHTGTQPIDTIEGLAEEIARPLGEHLQAANPHPQYATQTDITQAVQSAASLSRLHAIALSF